MVYFVLYIWLISEIGTIEIIASSEPISMVNFNKLKNFLLQLHCILHNKTIGTPYEKFWVKENFWIKYNTKYYWICKVVLLFTFSTKTILSCFNLFIIFLVSYICFQQTFILYWYFCLFFYFFLVQEKLFWLQKDWQGK